MAIPPDDFHAAAQKFVDACEPYKLRENWQNVSILRDNSIDFLSITQYLDVAAREYHQGTEEVPVDEDDEEVVTKTTYLVIRPTVVYDIVYSDTYQVPVLYLTFEDLESGTQPSLDELYDSLIPESTRSQMQSVGIMGALSLIEHPALRRPAFFVHPCRTQEVMEPLLREGEASPLGYLMLWFGVIGASVGLNIPVPLAEVLEKLLESDEKGKPHS